MTEILPRHYIFAGLIFSMLVIGVVSAITLIEKGTNAIDANAGFIQTNQLSEFNRSFNKYDNLSSDIKGLHKNIKGLEVEKTTDIISLPLAFVSTAWSGIKLVVGMFGFMDSAFEGLSAILGIPTWIPAILSLMIIIILVFAVLTIIFGKES